MKRALFLCLILASCKSGEGDRCQVDNDCSPPLVCNKAKNTCASNSGGGLDARIPDAAPADAAVLDAPPDAVPDAP